MATPPRSDAVKQSIKDRIEAKLREGYRASGATGQGKGAIAVAAEEALRDGEFRSIHAFVSAAHELKGEFLPDTSLYRPARYQQPMPRMAPQHAPPPDPEIDAPTGQPTIVLVIPDRHNDPRHEHRLACTTWIARLGSERRPPVVVDLGDAITMDSCSRYDRNDTLRGRMKPSIKADLDNHLASLQAFEAGRAPDWKPRRYKTRGNHEQRLWAFENEHPENEGSHTHTYAEQLLQFGWRERDYGEFVYVDGVAFTHAPINGMGRPMGGKTSTHRAGSLLTCGLVHGHTHALQLFSDPKHGPVDRITVIQAGCALPWGEYEAYATVTPGGWWWGCLILTCWAGQITDVEAISMLELKRRYG